MKNNNWVIGLSLILIFILSSFLNYQMSKDHFPNIDMSQNDLFSNLLIEKSTLQYSNDLNSRYEPKIFSIRGPLLREDGKIVPSSLLGYIIILSLFKSISEKITFLINPIFLLLGLIFFYKVSRFFLDKKYSFLASFFFLFSAPLFYISSIPFNNLCAASLYIIGLYFLLKGYYNKNPASYIISSIFFSMSIWVRLPMLIFLIPPVLTIFYLDKKDRIKKSIIPLIIFLIFGITLWLVNNNLYGSFLGFTTPYFRLNYYESFVGTAGLKNMIFNLFSLETMKIFILNLKNQIFLINPIITILSLLALPFIIRSKVNRPLKLSLIGIVVFQFLFYLTKIWSGYYFEGSVGTSYARYLLVSWGMIILFSVVGIKELFKNSIISKKILSVLIILIILSNIGVAIKSPMSFEYHKNTINWANNLKKDIEKHIPEDGIIFTNFNDKYIYPVRQTAIYSSIPKERRVETVINLIKDLLNDNKDVYWYNEDKTLPKGTITSKEFFKKFEKNGLEVKKSFRDIYKIVKKDET